MNNSYLFLFSQFTFNWADSFILGALDQGSTIEKATAWMEKKKKKKKSLYQFI